MHTNDHQYESYIFTRAHIRIHSSINTHIASIHTHIYPSYRLMTDTKKTDHRPARGVTINWPLNHSTITQIGLSFASWTSMSVLQHRINTSTCFTICVRGSCIHLHSVKTGTLTITCPINSKKLIFTTQHHSGIYIGSTRVRDSINHEWAQSNREYQSDKHHWSEKRLTWSCRFVSFTCCWGKISL